MPMPGSSAAVVAIGVLLAACTGGGNDSSTRGEPGSSVVPTAQAFDHDRQAPAEPIEGAVPAERSRC